MIPERRPGSPEAAVLRRRRWIHRWAVFASVAIAAVGGLVLLGWARDISALRSLSVSWVSMKPNAALGFLLAGLALLALTVGRWPPLRIAARALGAFVGLLGAATVLEYVLGTGFGIDQLLFREPPDAVGAGPAGRMSPTTSAALFVGGLGLTLLDTKSARGHRAAEWASLLVALLAFDVLVGYLYGVGLLAGVPNITRMSFHSAGTLALLSTGMLAARPDRGFAAFASSAGGEGVLLRKLLPSALLIPTILGFVVLLGTEAGLYDGAFAIALFVVLGTALLLVAVLRTTFEVVEVDRARREAEEAYREEASIVRTLNEVGELITAELDERALVQEITDAATACTAADFGAFFYNVEDAEGRRYQLYSLSGAPREAFERFPIPRASPLFERTFRGGPAVRLADVTRDPRYGRTAHRGLPEGHLSVRSYLAVPVRSREEEILGGLFFGHPEVGRFTAAHERMAVGIATWAGIALENARLLRRVHEAMQDREELVAVVSHDLRNTLQAATSAARAIELHIEEGGEVEPRLTAIIQRSVTQMGRLIQDLLDIHVIQTGRLRVEPRPHQAGTLVREAVDVAEVLARERGLQVEVRLDGSPMVRADRQRIVQVLTNLLSNAVKFTPPGGRITVGMEREGGEVRFSVADTGPGISQDALPHVFERFWSGSSDQGGVGLGLAIARAIVESHDGWIRAESPAGGGALFRFGLPAVSDEGAPFRAGSEGERERTSGGGRDDGAPAAADDRERAPSAEPSGHAGAGRGGVA